MECVIRGLLHHRSSHATHLLDSCLSCLSRQIPTLLLVMLRDHKLTHTHTPLVVTLCLETKLSPLLQTSQIIVSTCFFPLLICVNFVSILQGLCRGRSYSLQDTCCSRRSFHRAHQSKICAAPSHRQSCKTLHCKNGEHQKPYKL